MGDERTDYALLDAGAGRRLERFGPVVVDRPAPTAQGPRQATFSEWRAADLRFDAGRGWQWWTEARAAWPVEIEGVRLEVRPTDSGGLGLYPEHAASLAWVAARVRDRVAEPAMASDAPRPPAVLNLFAHTGLVTLGAAEAGAAVAHVDAARAAVDWARANAATSGLQDRPVRWLVDDAAGFVAREARRGRRYDGIVLDPPSFGRAGRRQWRLLDELPALLAACAAVATPGAFVLLTAHTAGIVGDDLRAALEAAFRPAVSVEVLPLGLEATSGARLDLGWAARLDPLAAGAGVPDGTVGHGKGAAPWETGRP